MEKYLGVYLMDGKSYQVTEFDGSYEFIDQSGNVYIYDYIPDRARKE